MASGTNDQKTPPVNQKLPQTQYGDLHRASGESAKRASRHGTKGLAPWEWNIPLALLTLVGLLVVGGISAISYRHQSSQAAVTFLNRAEDALEKQEYSEQAKWLNRYSLLKPSDIDAVVRMAQAADNAADLAEPEQLAGAIQNARKQLSDAIARLGEEGGASTTDLRRRLIKRLLALGGGYWHQEAETQVIALDADRDDPEAVSWLALALMGQVNAGTYLDRKADAFNENDEYWSWLAAQKVGEVLSRAVDQNEDDVDLISVFLDANRTNPELFVDARSTDQDSKRVESQIERVVSKMRSNDDSQSKLILYQFETFQGRDSAAATILQDAVTNATQRLANVHHSEAGQKLDANGLSPHYWDYITVLEAAGRFSGSDADQAESWYEQLMSFGSRGIPPTTVELAFASAGRLQESNGNRDRAIEIWERGLELLDSNSLELFASIATARSQDGDDEETSRSLDRFREALALATRQLSQASISQQNRAQRTSRARQIEAATWRLGVLEAMASIRQGRRIDAINSLSDAFNDSADVDKRYRIAVAKQLAALHGIEGAWDKAAEVYDRAVNLSPDDGELRMLAAGAWTRSGNRLEAIERWRLAGNSQSLIAQVTAAQASFDLQLKLIPEQRDFSGVRSLIHRIRTNLSTAKIGDDESAVAQLEVLEIFLPASGVRAEDHFASAGVADRLAKLAEKYASNPGIQAFVAQRLAAVGRDQESRAALERLESIVGKSSSSLTVAAARIEAANGEHETAARHLIEQAQRDTANAVDLLGLAAAIAAQANDSELAYEAINGIPDDRRTQSMLFRIALSARRLPKDSSFLVKDGVDIKPLELSMQWEERLRQLEGENGSYWRYLRAERTIDQLQSSPNLVEKDDPLLIAAKQETQDLLEVRPHWGFAISLQGRLFAIQGAREKAVEQLRAGLAAGDRRLQTRQLLWRQLSLLNRWQEADEVIRVATSDTDSNVDKYSALRIGLAIDQKDFRRSLELAESGIVERPDDFLSHVVLCSTATLAAKDAKKPDERTALLQRARRAIDEAQKLVAKDEPSIYAARLQLALAGGDEQDVRNEISLVEKSQLTELVKLNLAARTRIELRDYQAALADLMRVHQIEPSIGTDLVLADLFRNLRRPDDEIAALRRAHRLQRNNAGIRNRLAHAIAARDGQDINWTEIRELLSSDTDVTPSNRFLYAVLLAAGGVQKDRLANDLAVRGSQQQQVEATRILRELVDEKNSRSDDASRVLALVLQDRSRDLPTDQQALRQQWLDEVRSLYESLSLSITPQIADLYRYGLFLLEFGDEEDAKLRQIQSQLGASSGGVVFALDIAIKQVRQSGNEASVPEVVDRWAEEAIRESVLDEVAVASVAGASLFQLDFVDASLPWFEKAYRGNPDTLTNYVVALRRADREEKTVGICSKHFDAHGDAKSATLLVETLVSLGKQYTSSQHEKIIEQALEKYGRDAALLETVANLRLQQQSYMDSVKLYHRSLEVDPKRVEALNNLAMALSEVPGHEAEGIEPIDRAIKIAGQTLELLDTKGVVLLKAGRFDDATTLFQNLVQRSDDPRYRFHLILALLAQQNESDAKRVWNSLDLDKLDPRGLVPSERERLDDLGRRFGP